MGNSSASHKVLFFGTPEIAVPCLEALHAAPGYDVVGVVTKPDKPVGRKQVMTPSAVAQAADALGVSVFKPKTLRPNKPAGLTAIEELSALGADVCVVFAYGKILPREVLEMTPHGCVNVHPSLLPELRGPSPIQSAILHGLLETGISIMLLDEEMDTGPLLLQRALKVGERETAKTLHDRVAEEAPPVLLEALDGYLDGTLTPEPQDNAKATYCELIKKEDGEIDWSCSPAEIDRQIRALTPWPGAFTIKDGLRVKILEAHVENGRLKIDTVQPAGKKPMLYEEFVRGYGALL